MSKKVSVIITAYQSENTIEKCVLSVLEQTYPDVEILVIDDGSTDKTREICEKIQKNNSKIHLYCQANSGVSVARNNGLSHATGEFVMFLDSDDYLRRDAAELLIRKTQEYPESQAILFGFHEFWGNTGMQADFSYPDTVYETTEKLMEAYPELLMSRVASSAALTLYHRDIIFKNHIAFYPWMAYGEDTLFLFQYLTCCKQVMIISDILYHCQRVNPKSLTKSWDYVRLECLKTLIDTEKQYFAHHPIATEKEQLLNTFFTLHYLNYIQDLYDNHSSKKQFLQDFMKVVAGNQWDRMPCCKSAFTLNNHVMLFLIRCGRNQLLYFYLTCKKMVKALMKMCRATAGR